jgi:hypothetical protein
LNEKQKENEEMINKRKKKKALNIENEKSEEEKIFEELSIKLK